MKNAKAWAQFALAIVMAVWSALTDTESTDAITPAELVVIITMAVGAFGVWVVPNLDTGIGNFAKTVVSFLTAGLPVIALAISDGLTNAELLEAVIAGAVAIGLVAGVGNKPYVFATKDRSLAPGGTTSV